MHRLQENVVINTKNKSHAVTAVAVGVRSRTVVADNAAERLARGLIRRRPRIESP